MYMPYGLTLWMPGCRDLTLYASMSIEHKPTSELQP